MNVEIRSDSVVIDGYVNAVERDSKVLCDKRGRFVEKIEEGAFKRALDRNPKVKVLLNHNYKRELTNLQNANCTLKEDAIGLRCICEITDAEVVQKAKEKKLVGWSFGFNALRERRELKEGEEIAHRTVKDLDLREVSILDDTKVPAYNGTSIETRDIDEGILCVRDFTDNVEYETRDNGNTNDKYYLEIEQRILATRVPTN